MITLRGKKAMKKIQGLTVLLLTVLLLMAAGDSDTPRDRPRRNIIAVREDR